jgi:hypothetical protein
MRGVHSSKRYAEQFGDDERREWMAEAGQDVPRFVGVGGVEQFVGQAGDPAPQVLHPLGGEHPRRHPPQDGVLGRVVVVQPAPHVVERRPGKRLVPQRLEETAAGPEERVAQRRGDVVVGGEDQPETARDVPWFGLPELVQLGVGVDAE